MLKKLIDKITKKQSRKQKSISGIIEKKYINKFLPRNPTIVEAGAHIGSDTIEMSKIWRKGEIHAFEPVPYLYKQLIQNTKDIQNIKCYSMALSDKEGNSKIFISSGNSNASSSLLKPKEHLLYHPDVIFQENLIIQTTTLDLWASANDINRVDLLWLDLQGYEPLKLRVSPKILKTVKVIYTEVNLKELYQGAILYPEFSQWLNQQGFSVKREELPWEDAGNVLFVRA
jgi:FkbM family methyltransferase